MKKIIMNICLIGVFALVLTGCTKSKSVTYKVDNGDIIKITLKTNGGYTIDTKMPFTIYKDEKEVSKGSFIQSDYYDSYVSAVKISGKIIEEKSTDKIDYIFYSFNNSEYNYVIKIKNSKTALLLGNQTSEESAEKVFKLLSFSKEK